MLAQQRRCKHLMFSGCFYIKYAVIMFARVGVIGVRRALAKAPVRAAIQPGHAMARPAQCIRFASTVSSHVGCLIFLFFAKSGDCNNDGGRASSKYRLRFSTEVNGSTMTAS